VLDFGPQRVGCVVVTQLLQVLGQVAGRVQGLRVLGAQDALLAGEHLLMQPDGQPHLAGVLIDGGQVAPNAMVT